MQTFTESVLNHVEEPEQHDEFTIDYSRVVRVLLRDGWHNVYKTTEKDREGLAVTLGNIRKKLDHPNPSTPYTAAELIEQYPQFVPYAQNPKLQPKPLSQVTINGEPWLRWNESRAPVPILAELLVPFSQVLALDMEKGIA